MRISSDLSSLSLLCLAWAIPCERAAAAGEDPIIQEVAVWVGPPADSRELYQGAMEPFRQVAACAASAVDGAKRPVEVDITLKVAEDGEVQNASVSGLILDVGEQETERIKSCIVDVASGLRLQPTGAEGTLDGNLMLRLVEGAPPQPQVHVMASHRAPEGWALAASRPRRAGERGLLKAMERQMDLMDLMEMEEHAIGALDPLGSRSSGGPIPAPRGGGGLGRRGSEGVGGHGQVTAPTDEPVRGVPTVEIASPLVKGNLDEADLRRVIRRSMPMVRYCWERALLEAPGDTREGRVLLSFVVGTKGDVVTANVAETTLEMPEVEGCILNRIKRLRFPKPQGGGVVRASVGLNFGVEE